MAYYPKCRLEIGDFRFDACESIEIESSWREGAKATLRLPGRGVLRKGDSKEPVSLEQILKTGLLVRVWLRYEGFEERLEFEGYVAEIKPKFGVELRCEDEMYQLRRAGSISKSYKRIGIAALLKELVPEVQLGENLPAIVIDNFQINKATKAQVLAELREKYGLAVYFRGKTLYVGLPYLELALQQQAVAYNLLRNIVSEDLAYVRSEDVRLKAKAVSFLSNNTKIEAEVGDSDGEERTLFYYKISDKEALRKLAAADLQKYKYEGYRGKITGFGLPFCAHGMSAEIQDDRYSERPKARYLIEATKVRFDTGGFRQEVELGRKIS